MRQTGVLHYFRHRDVIEARSRNKRAGATKIRATRSLLTFTCASPNPFNLDMMIIM